MIVLRTPKGWTGPAEIDGKPIEGTWRSHQVPFAQVRDNPDHLAALEHLAARCYRPEELFDDLGRQLPTCSACRRPGRRADERQPARERRRAGRASCELPDFARVRRRRAGARPTTAKRHTGPRGLAADVMRRQPRRRSASSARTRRPPTGCRRSSSVTDRAWLAETGVGDDHLAADGRVMEILSEHLCQGWLEGYLLTGRHGLFNCYEAFIHIVDSMFNQHAKWLEVTREIAWRAPDRLAELPADLARVAPGPQRLLPPGPRLHRPSW